MKLKESANEHISISNPDAQFDPNVTFLQIPVQIKDRVLDYIAELVKEDAELEKTLKKDTSPYERSGCFFVVSLETIEEIMDCLNQALKTDSNQPQLIKNDIQRALNLLNGQ